MFYLGVERRGINLISQCAAYKQCIMFISWVLGFLPLTKQDKWVTVIKARCSANRTKVTGHCIVPSPSFCLVWPTAASLDLSLDMVDNVTHQCARVPSLAAYMRVCGWTSQSSSGRDNCPSHSHLNMSVRIYLNKGSLVQLAYITFKSCLGHYLV